MQNLNEFVRLYKIMFHQLGLGLLKTFLIAICLMVSLINKDVNGSDCNVTSNASAVVAGKSISLVCTSSIGYLVQSWQLGSDAANTLFIYQATYSLNVTGYSVQSQQNNVVAVVINYATLMQAGSYICTCLNLNYYNRSNSTTNLVVLASRPWFSNTTNIVSGSLVDILCSISFNGTANSMLAIKDSSGKNVNDTSEMATGTVAMYSYSVMYSFVADASINQTYTCNVNVLPYNDTVSYSVQWNPVWTNLIPENSMQCMTGGDCAINQTLLCSADGNPEPNRFMWVIYINGTNWITMDSSNSYILTEYGSYNCQCTAFNTFIGVTYNSSSTFITNVTPHPQFPTPAPSTGGDNGNSLIIGLVVGIVGGILVIALIVIIAIFLIKRKNQRTVCCKTDETKNGESVEIQKSNRYSLSKEKSNGMNNSAFNSSAENVPAPAFKTTSCDETILYENDLYSGLNKKPDEDAPPHQLDPSDGGYASINEVVANKKRK